MQISRAAPSCFRGPVPRAVISRWAPVGWPGERGAGRSRARCLRGAHPPLRRAASALGVTPPPTVQPGFPRAAAGWFAVALPVVSPTNHVLIEVGSEPYKPAPRRPESRPWGRGHCAQAGAEMPGPSGVSPAPDPWRVRCGLLQIGAKVPFGFLSQIGGHGHGQGRGRREHPGFF